MSGCGWVADMCRAAAGMFSDTNVTLYNWPVRTVVLNLQPYEPFLCERKQPSSFQHLKGYVINPY